MMQQGNRFCDLGRARQCAAPFGGAFAVPGSACARMGLCCLLRCRLHADCTLGCVRIACTALWIHHQNAHTERAQVAPLAAVRLVSKTCTACSTYGWLHEVLATSAESAWHGTCHYHAAEPLDISFASPRAMPCNGCRHGGCNVCSNCHDCACCGR